MATRMQQRRGTAAQWTSANPVLNAGEMGWESDTNKFKIGDGTNHWADLDYFADINSTVNPAFGTSIIFEGATADSYETTLQVTDPTADRTITLPNASGTVITTGNLSDITDIGVFSSTITMEGSTPDAYELTLSAGDPTADRTITFPDATGTVALTSDITGISASSTDTLTNKSISLANNTITGTTAQFNTALSDSNFVTTGDTGTVTSTMIANGTIVDGDINASAAIAQSKISGLTTDLGNKQDKVSGVSDTEIGYLDGVTSAIQTQIDSKLSTSTASSTYAPLASPTFTGTVTLPSGTVTSTMILDGTIANADINASAAIALSKLATDPLARANHTGTQTASTISDFDTQVRTSKVTDLAAPTGSFSMNSQKITNLGTPTADADAATKAYVDAATAGLNVHASVQAATTANVTLASALENGDTLDGVTLATGNRVLVKNQTDKTENGIYVVKASGAPDRATDYDSTPEVDAGDFIFVEAGTVNGKTGWVQTNVITTIGSDNIEFTQFSGSGTYSAGNGLTLTGNVFTIDTAITQTRVSGVSDTEIGYLDGVTSAIQTQLNAKQAVVSGVSDTEIGYLDGVTSAIQTQLDAKAPTNNASFTGTFSAPSGTITSTMIADGTITNNDINASAAIAQSKIDNLTTDLAAKAPLASPTFTGTVTIPNGAGLGTPTTLTLTNATGLPVSTGISGLGTGIATALAVNTGSAGAPVLFNGALGTPSSGTLTNATGLPLTTGVTGTLPIANGGTGQTTASAAANALLPSQGSNSGKYLTTDGTNLSWATVAGGISASSTDTLTNKSISLATNTVTGTIAQFNTAVTDADFATLAGTETFTNKTLTSPKINENVTLTATATELNYMVGVSSAVQTQLNAKAGYTSPINSQSGTTYTLVLDDHKQTVLCTSSSAVTVTIPPESSVAWPAGSLVTIVQNGTGQITVAAGSGVTLNTQGGAGGRKTRYQHQVASLYKTGTDTWMITGDLIVP